MIEKPQFRRGNKWFVEALNTLADFAQRSGVNPNGVPGWVETPTGWHPPASRLELLDGGSKWDLIPEPIEEDEEETGKYILFEPLVEFDPNDVESVDEVAHSPLTPESGKILVMEITSLALPLEIEIKQVAPDWLGYPSPYEFPPSSPFALVAARFPLWRFYASDGDGRRQLGENLFGEKLVPSTIQRFVSRAAQVRDTARFIAVPGLA